MQKYDVSILGSGIAGSMLACILARKGLNVLLIEGGQHPRFAIGESTIPVTSLMAEMMGTHYDIPEIKALSSHNIVSESLSSQCGVKKGFGFIYHRPYQEHNKQEVVQTYLPHPETHLFRQDIDAQLAYAAVKYGATLKQSCKIRDLHFDNSGVILKSESGRSLSVRLYRRWMWLQISSCQAVQLKGKSATIQDTLAKYIYSYDRCRFV